VAALLTLGTVWPGGLVLEARGREGEGVVLGEVESAVVDEGEAAVSEAEAEGDGDAVSTPVVAQMGGHCPTSSGSESESELSELDSLSEVDGSSFFIKSSESMSLSEEEGERGRLVAGWSLVVHSL
jgi:hypothetical protein